MAETATATPINITLGDGTVVKAENIEEGFKIVAKMKEDTAAELKKTREQLSTFESNQASLQAEIEKLKKPVQTNGNAQFDKQHYYEMLNSDPMEAQNYLDAFRFGIPDPAQVPQTFINMNQQVSSLTQQTVVAAFLQQHAEDFPPDPVAAKALTTKTQELIQSGIPFNLDTVNYAYSQLVNSGTIKPVETKQTEEVQETANPSLTGGSGNVDAEMAKVEQMSDADLEKHLRAKGLLR